MPRRSPLYDSILDSLFPPTHSASTGRKAQILEAAIKSYVRNGVEKTTPGRIAQICKVSRPLVLHYFPNRQELFDYVVRYIRARFQQIAIEAIQKASTPRQQLEAYVDSTFDWIRLYPEHAKVWLLFFYYCSIERKRLQMHSELTEMGRSRIQALLEMGTKSGDFACHEPGLVAKMIQVAISGALLSVLTEASVVPPEKIRTETLRLCFHLAGATYSTPG